jgi:branched-chain amino acid transport system ATP-binding protein
MTLLSISDLTASYGASQALFGVDLGVAEGEVVALMGRNGMGKTTTVRAICRMIPSEGRLTFAGADLHAMPSHRAARAGIGLVPEGRRCFAGLTVSENLTAAARPGPWSMARVHALFPRLAERAGQRAASLSGGEQQMLAIGRALIAQPKLILLDEPSLGLSPLLVEEIFTIIGRINRQTGVSMLLVEQNANVAMAIAHYGYIMETGKIQLDGPTEKLMHDQDVREFYLGHGGHGGEKSYRNIKHYKRRKRWLS